MKDYLFALDEKRKPSMDLMSKLILLKAEITNLIIKKFIGMFAHHLGICNILLIYCINREPFVGPNAVDKYKGIPTEWPNLMKSDVVYEPFSYKNRCLPPVLIEIQHTVDLKCYQRVIQYCLQMIKRYPVLPIVIIIGITNTTQDILEMVVKEDPEVPFAARLPCAGWAQSFYLINAGTIRTHLDTKPLEPTVAIAHFFIEQKLSLISMKRRDDATIQLLFKYAKDIFNGDIGNFNSILDAFDTTCNQFHRQLIKAKQTLTEDINHTKSRKRTAQVLEDGILFVNKMRKKHSLSQEPSATSSSSSTTSSTISSTTSSTDFDSLPVVQHKSSSWLFVDVWRKHTGDEMDWELCFKIGNDLGLFDKYKSKASLKAAYFRAKSNTN